MLAERCPNCGAFLPVRRAGVTVRTCEFCELEVPGDAPIVEVPRLTTERPAVRPPPDEPPTPARRSGAGRGMIFVILAPLAVLAIIAVAVRGGGKRSPPAPPTPDEQPAAPAQAEQGPPAPPPDPPERVALRAAVEQAGGLTALDPVALLAHVDGRVRAGTPDAVLLLLRCTRVRTGRADLQITADSRCAYEYRVPSRARRPDDVPEGVATRVPCQRWFSVDAGLDELAPTEHSYGPDDCRRRVAVRPPRCTMAEVWQRAVDGGIPPAAVASLGFGARYRSPYDPIDPADDPDRPERGRWSVDVERDGADDLRVTFHDDCGHAATADEQAVTAAFERAAARFRRCYTTGAAGHAAVQAFEQIWRLTVDARGRATIAFSDPAIDIEGMFSGDLDAYRARFADCAAAIVPSLRLPPALPALRVELRVDAAALTISPPPFD